jgi:hypothetical protein
MCKNYGMMDFEDRGVGLTIMQKSAIPQDYSIHIYVSNQRFTKMKQH